MKKIKLLLLGIVSILGISCSFGTYRQNDVDYNIGFYVKNLEFISDYGYGYFSVNSTNDGLNFNTGSNFYYSNCFGLSNCSDSQIFGIAGIGTDSFSVLRNMRSYYGDGFFSIYSFDGSHNGTIYNLLESSNYSSTNIITPTEGQFANSINYYYTRLFLDSSNTSNSNFSNWLLSGTAFGGVVGQKYQIFRIDYPSQVIRSDGLKYDCLLLSGTDIVECSKSFISAGFVDGYSFAINQDGIVNFRSVLNGFADSYSYFIESGENQYQPGYTLDGVYIMKLNSFGVINTGNYLLAMALNGNNLDFSIYNCPNNSLNISSCLFEKGGTLVENFLNSDFYNYIFAPHYNYNGGFHGNSFHFVNYYNSDTSKLYLYRGTAFNGYLEYGFNGFSSFTLNLSQSSDNPNILNRFINYSPDSGNGSQSTGSIAINTGLLNLCLNDLQFGELNSYLCNQLLSNLGNPVQIPGTSGQYISVSIDENGNLRYWITTQEDLVEQMSGFVWVENEDGTRSTICPSGNCLGTILAQPINHGNSGFEFTTGTVLDMITNLTGWVGRCPFPYTDFRLGKNLNLLQIFQNYGFEYDPFIFVNCAVAGFHYGRHSIDRQIFDDTFEHPLLYGDTQKHRSLFVFLDFIVILGLLGLSSFLKKIF